MEQTQSFDPSAQHFKSGCAGKVGYPSEEAALTVRQLFKRGKYFQARGGGDLDVYHCEFCHEWHLGHN